MKIQIILITICFSKFISNAQSFEGKIIIKTEFYKNIPNTNISENQASTIDTSVFYIQNDKFRSSSLTFNKFSYTIQLHNKNYFVEEKSKTIIYDTGSDSTIKIFNNLSHSLKQKRSKKKIIGYPCVEYDFIIKSKIDGKLSKSAWISNSLQFEQSYFEFFIKDIGLVIRSISKFKSGIAYQDVIEVLPMKLDTKIFELPNYPVEEVDMAKKAKAFINNNE